MAGTPLRAPVFIIDDDPHFCALCAGQLSERDIHAVSFPSLLDAFEASVGLPSVIILDWQLGSMESLAELPRIRARFPHAPIVLTTAAPSVNLVVRAMKAGAFDFLPKPLLDEGRLFATVSKGIAHGRLLARAGDLVVQAAQGQILGQSASMRAVMDAIRMAAPTDATLFILGESGTGKELAANAAHRLSGRKGELVCVNMAALPRELVESTLFGHERGSFTGADKQRRGLCEQAHDGTLFFELLKVGSSRSHLTPEIPKAAGTVGILYGLAISPKAGRSRVQVCRSYSGRLFPRGQSRPR